MSTDEQLASIVDRILSLKDEADQIASDIRDVYAEAKSNGFDKTALGQLVSDLRKRAKNPSAFEERSATVDLYATAYQRARSSHAHAYARDAAE